MRLNFNDLEMLKPLLKEQTQSELDFIIKYLTKLCEENPEFELCDGDYFLHPQNDRERAKNRSIFPHDLNPMYRGASGRVYLEKDKIIKSSVDIIDNELHELFVNLIIKDFIRKNPKFKNNFIDISGFFLCGQNVVEKLQLQLVGNQHSKKFLFHIPIKNRDQFKLKTLDCDGKFIFSDEKGEHLLKKVEYYENFLTLTSDSEIDLKKGMVNIDYLPKIIDRNILDVCVDTNLKLHIIQEYKNECLTLKDLLQENALTYEQFMLITIKVFTILDELYKYEIDGEQCYFRHMDLHVGNIMVDISTWEPIIFDFGLSSIKYKGKYYTSPEDQTKETKFFTKYGIDETFKNYCLSDLVFFVRLV